ncbi:MAG: HNH endonuclease family protein, partial [Syntrophales bacterium]|nr:HNH endonuclease family protein [Syntrophales bacterium]
NFEFDNLVKVMLCGLPATDWVPPLLRYFDKFGYARIMDFLRKLDNKFSSDWVSQYTPTDRIEAMNNVIKVIDTAALIDDVFSSDCFNIDDASFRRILDEPVYGRRFARYFLLKLDYLYQDHYQRMHFETLSVEHILPQNPAEDSQWRKDFTPEQMEEWTHKLGNLVLITGRKNTSQGRLDYEDKVKKYFTNNIDTCPNSLRVLKKYNKWGPSELICNHLTVLSKIREHYGLSKDIPSASVSLA